MVLTTTLWASSLLLLLLPLQRRDARVHGGSVPVPATYDDTQCHAVCDEDTGDTSGHACQISCTPLCQEPVCAFFDASGNQIVLGSGESGPECETVCNSDSPVDVWQSCPTCEVRCGSDQQCGSSTDSCSIRCNEPVCQWQCIKPSAAECLGSGSNCRVQCPTQDSADFPCVLFDNAVPIPLTIDRVQPSPSSGTVLSTPDCRVRARSETPVVGECEPSCLPAECFIAVQNDEDEDAVYYRIPASGCNAVCESIRGPDDKSCPSCEWECLQITAPVSTPFAAPSTLDYLQITVLDTSVTDAQSLTLTEFDAYCDSGCTFTSSTSSAISVTIPDHAVGEIEFQPLAVPPCTTYTVYVTATRDSDSATLLQRIDIVVSATLDTNASFSHMHQAGNVNRVSNNVPLFSQAVNTYSDSDYYPSIPGFGCAIDNAVVEFGIELLIPDTCTPTLVPVPLTNVPSSAQVHAEAAGSSLHLYRVFAQGTDIPDFIDALENQAGGILSLNCTGTETFAFLQQLYVTDSVTLYYKSAPYVLIALADDLILSRKFNRKEVAGASVLSSHARRRQVTAAAPKPQSSSRHAVSRNQRLSQSELRAAVSAHAYLEASVETLIGLCARPGIICSSFCFDPSCYWHCSRPVSVSISRFEVTCPTGDGCDVAEIASAPGDYVGVTGTPTPTRRTPSTTSVPPVVTRPPPSNNSAEHLIATRVYAILCALVLLAMIA